jgi:hypothetical protein
VGPDDEDEAGVAQDADLFAVPPPVDVAPGAAGAQAKREAPAGDTPGTAPAAGDAGVLGGLWRRFRRRPGQDAR